MVLTVCGACTLGTVTCCLIFRAAPDSVVYVPVFPNVPCAGMLPQEFRSAGVGIQHLLHSLGWFGVEVA